MVPGSSDLEFYHFPMTGADNTSRRLRGGRSSLCGGASLLRRYKLSCGEILPALRNTVEGSISDTLNKSK